MPPRKQQGRAMFQATEAFVTEDGETVGRNDLVREGHPLLAAHPGSFRPAAPRFEVPEVEQTTAGPGEKRGDK